MENKEWLVIRGKNYRTNIYGGVTTAYVINSTHKMLKMAGRLFGLPQRQVSSIRLTYAWFIAYECPYFSFDMTLTLHMDRSGDCCFRLHFYDDMLTSEYMFNKMKMIENILKGDEKFDIRRN